MKKKTTSSIFDLFNNIYDSVKSADSIKMNDEPKKQSLDKTPKEQRDQTYSNLASYYAENYNERHKLKNKLKKNFFVITMISYCVVVAAALFILVASLFIPNPNVALIIGAIGTIITNLIAIPMIIAQYLFSKEEDINIVNMVKELFVFDKSLTETQREEELNKISEDIKQERPKKKKEKDD